MSTKLLAAACVASAALSTASISRAPSHHASKTPTIVGAWRSKVQFTSGPYSAVKDLKFLIVFSAGGTLTESSNYDGAPPVPPAYGIWRKIGRNEFELRYEYFNSKPPAKFEDLSGGGGWMPGGVGVLRERIKLSADGQFFTSKLTFVLRDESGKVLPGGGSAKCQGERMKF